MPKVRRFFPEALWDDSEFTSMCRCFSLLDKPYVLALAKEGGNEIAAYDRVRAAGLLDEDDLRLETSPNEPTFIGRNRYFIGELEKLGVDVVGIFRDAYPFSASIASLTDVPKRFRRGTAEMKMAEMAKGTGSTAHFSPSALLDFLKTCDREPVFKNEDYIRAWRKRTGAKRGKIIAECPCSERDAYEYKRDYVKLFLFKIGAVDSESCDYGPVEVFLRIFDVYFHRYDDGICIRESTPGMFLRNWVFDHGKW